MKQLLQLLSFVVNTFGYIRIFTTNTRLDPNCEDGVGAGGVLVHARRRRHAALDALSQEAGAVPDRLHVVHCQV